MRKRLCLLATLVLVIALVAPASALATFNWKRSPVDPLIRGGVHTKSGFIRLLTSSAKERNAIKLVIKADKYPSWIFGVAVAEARAGHVHSTSLTKGTYIGAMAFGVGRTQIVKKTRWMGRGRLPYYYVQASKTATEGAYLVTRSYRVCVSKTCANPFILPGRTVRRQLYKLYVEKRYWQENNRLGEWNITGTAGADAVSVITSAEGPTLVGQYPAGTAYNLSEVQQEGWTAQDPASGTRSGTMPASDLILTWYNSQGEIPD